MNQIHLEDMISRSDRIAQRQFEDQMMIITIHDSKLHKLNRVGTFVWHLLEKPTSVAEICRAISENFDLFDSNRHFPEMARFLRDLWEKRLIDVKKGQKPS